MNQRVSQWHSLKTRATVFTVAIFVLGIWSLSLFVSRSLQADMERLLGEQQLSVVTAVAKNINDDLNERLQALQTVAKTDAVLMVNPAALQARLEQRPLLQQLFNGGVWVAGLDGTVIADVPLAAQRIGVNYMDRDFIAGVLKEGRPIIGRPVMGKKLKSPLFNITVPVRDAQGQVTGVLAGVIDLGKANFLDKVTQNSYGKSGGYLLMAPQHKLIVTSSDKSRTMQPMPVAGLNAMHDRYMQGYEGFGIAVNSRGVEELSAAKRIPVSDWFLATVMPSEEAFAPVYSLQHRLLWATLVLTLLTGALTWWVLKRQLAPLVETAGAMEALADSAQIPQPLTSKPHGEIGQLVAGFNRILQTWKQREATLLDSQQNLSITLNSIGDAVITTDAAGCITGMNPTAERLTAWRLTDALGKPLTDVFRIISAQTRLPSVNPVQLVMEHGKVVGLANHTTLLARDGGESQIADSAAPIRNATDQIVGVVLVFSDVTEKYRIELALTKSEQQYRTLLENLSSGVVVHGPDTSILLANAMAASLLGLTQDQLLGKTAPDPDWCFLRDDGTPMPLDAYPVNRVLATGLPLQNYVVGVRPPGRTEPTWLICNAYVSRDDDSSVLRVVVTFTDITLRKQAELALQHRKTMLERTESLAHVASFEWDVDTNTVTWSPEMFRLFGRDPALGIPNLEGQVELYTPASTQTLFGAVGKAVSDGTPYTIELMTVQPDGEQRPCIAKGFPERDFSGRVVRIAGLVQDITERKQAEAALMASEERWKFAIEGSGDGLWDWNIQTGKAYYSPRYKTMLGFAEDEIGETADEWSKRIHPNDAPGVFAAMQPYMDGKPGTATVEFRMLRKDGLWQWMLGRGMVMERDAQGKALRMIGINTDMTERKQAQVALRESEVRFRTMFELAADAIVLHRGGTLVFMNPAAVSMFGAQSDRDLIGKGILELIHPDDRAVVLARINTAIVSGKMSPAMEGRYLKLDGTVFHADAQGQAIVLEGVPTMLSTLRDSSERRRAQEKLQLAAGVFTHALEGIMITAPDATIMDVNEAFTRITGYSHEDAIGRNPSMLKSGRQDLVFYKDMWHNLTNQGHWSGEVWNRRKNGEVYAELLTISAVRDEHGDTQQYVALFSDITPMKEHQSQLEHIAHFDALTNLPNRLLLADRLQQAMAQAQRRGKQLAVAYLDLDGFKNVNDQHGHGVGDQLLIALATGMKDTLREGDTLARLGGDEFVAVLIDLDGLASCEHMLERLLEAAAATVQLGPDAGGGEVALQCSASIGVTFYPQAQGIESDQLLRQADQAMYQAKLAGKNRYHFFDAAQDSSMRVHHESLERIRLALAQREFVLHYQPKVNMHSGQVVGAEALIRWQHPEKGLLAPATFLPVIEDHPLAVDVGEWVIDTALTQIERWRADGLELPVSVNIGARQLQQADFVERLQAILARHPQVNPTSLELEVLETSALADITQVSQVIEACAQIGVKFALDDFGTGYSSLTYLKRLRVALLKIDQSFVRDMLDDPDDLAILEGVIGLAAAFKREVIAEGVETVAHGTALLQLGCELAQGYGIARPMPPEQLPAWTAIWEPDAAWYELPWLGGQD